MSDTHYDVRFFGGKYERSLLQKMYIKPIDTPKDSLMVSLAIYNYETKFQLHILLYQLNLKTFVINFLFIL